MHIGRKTFLALAATTLVAGGAQACPGGDKGAFRAAAAEAFTAADADRSGGLTAAEFATFHDVLREKMAAARFAALDTNDDGIVTQAELEAGRPHHGGHGRGKRGPRS